MDHSLPEPLQLTKSYLIDSLIPQLFTNDIDDTEKSATHAEKNGLKLIQEPVLTLSLALSVEMVMNSLQLLETKSCLVYKFKNCVMLVIQERKSFNAYYGQEDMETEYDHHSLVDHKGDPLHGTNTHFHTNTNGIQTNSNKSNLNIIDKPQSKKRRKNQKKSTEHTNSTSKDQIFIVDTKLWFCTCPDSFGKDDSNMKKWCCHLLAFSIYEMNKKAIDANGLVSSVDIRSLEQWVNLNDLFLRNC